MFFCFDEIQRLGHFSGRRQIFFCCRFIAIPEVVGDGTGEQGPLLGHQSDPFPQIVLFHFPHVPAVQQDLPLGHIIKPGDQLDQSRFAAPCAADDGGGLPGPGREGDIRQGILFGAGIGEAGMAEFHQAAGKGFLLRRRFPRMVYGHRCRRIGDAQLRAQHFSDPLGGYHGPGQQDKDRCHEEEGHDHMHGVLQVGQHVADQQFIRLNQMGARPDDQNADRIHHEHQRGHEK